MPIPDLSKGPRDDERWATLTTILTTLTQALEQVAYNTSAKAEAHVPAVAPASKGYGVFCFACSEAAGTYVYPCTDPRTKLDDWPVQWLQEVPSSPPSDGS